MADADTSVLDLGSKSPPPRRSLDRTGAADTARSAPYTNVNLNLSWEYPKDKSSNESTDSAESGSKKILVYHDWRDVTDSGDEGNEVRETTKSIMRGIKIASVNIALYIHLYGEV